MNKSDFIADIAGRTGWPVSRVKLFVKQMLDHITEEIKQGREVRFRGMGTFFAFEMKESKRINPKTGKTMFVSARKIPKFRVSKKFREDLRKIRS